MDSVHVTGRAPSPLRPSAGAATAAGGRFVLRERLGAGAFSVTYRARDMHAGHEVALRVVTPPADRLDDTLTQLRAGADAVTALRHAGIVPPATVQRDGEVLLWATPFLDGGSVGELLDMPEPLPFDAVAALVSDAAAALAAAHARGVVHGGLKPTNIFADADGRARITDFGVHDVERALARGHAGIAHALGPYAAPEQWRGAIADARTDQYALAAIAYELITGRRREASVVEGIATLEPLEVQTLGPLRPGLDMRVNEVLRTALSASPVNRFAARPSSSRHSPPRPGRVVTCHGAAAGRGCARGTSPPSASWGSRPRSWRSRSTPTSAAP
jgi:serine/threonine-protein kinase